MSLQKPSTLRKPLVIRRIVGHSMLPILPPGTLVLGSGLLPRARRHAVVIVSHEGKEKIKRITDIRDNMIYIIGDHEDDSTDSRHFGWLPKTSVVATIIWPRTKKKT